MSGQDKTLKVGAARYCFLVDLAHVQLNYTYGLALASIRRFQLLGMKAPQFGHGSPKRAGEGPVVESQAVPGLPSVVAPPDLRREGAYEAARVCAYGVHTRQRNAQRECRAMRGMGKRTCSSVGIGVASVQGSSGEEGQTKGRQDAEQMVVEQLTVPEPRQ